MDEVIFAGVDDGHYSIKVVTQTGQSFVVPSRAAQGRHVISIQDQDDDFYKTEEGMSFTVNPYLTNTDDTRFMDYPKSALNRVLVHHALRVAGLGGKRVQIATGLPVSYFYLNNGVPNEELIKAKEANLQKPVICGSPLASIVKNVVTTEAIAAYFDQIMDLEGRPTELFHQISDLSLGIIDIGGKTTDCAVILPGKGAQVDVNRSGSNDVGVLMLNDAVKSKLKQQFDLDNIPERMVESAIREGKVSIAGARQDVEKMVLQEKECLAEKIMSVVRTRIGSGKDLDFVLFVGGGAVVMKDQISTHFPHIRFPESPEFANARGMLKIAKYVAK